MKRRSYFRNGFHLMYVKNRGIGTQVFAKKLVARCHICNTPDTHAELTKCRRCYNMACPAHYDYHQQLCSDCAQLYTAYMQGRDADD